MVSLNCFKSRKKSKKRSRDKNGKVKSSSSEDNGLLSPRSNASGIKTLNSNASTKDTSLSGISRGSSHHHHHHDDSSIPTIDSDYNHLGNTNFSLSDAGGTIGSRSLANFSHATSAFGGTIGNTVGGGGDSVERRMYNDVYNMTGGYNSSSSEQHLSHLIQPPSVLQSNNNHHHHGGGGSAQETTFVIDAPKGKLGVVIDTPMLMSSSSPGKTMPIVHAVKDSSPIADRIQVGDKLIAVDGEDVTSLNAIQVSKLLARKSGEEVRRLTVVRMMRGRGGIY